MTPSPGRIGTQTAGTTSPTSPLAQSPTGQAASSFNYGALSPSQQQAYGNGVPWNQLGTPGSAYGSATPAAGAGSAPVSATNASGFTAVPFGNSTSYPVSPSSEYQSQLSYQNSPMMTPAAIANQNAVAAAGDPMYGQTVNINGQMVPYNSLSQTQAAMLSYFNSTGQPIPANFMQTYAGPNTAANAGYSQAGVGSGTTVTPQGTVAPVQTGQLMNPTQTGNYVPYTAASNTPYAANGTLAQTAAGANTSTGSSNSLSNYLTTLLSQVLYGNGTNSSSQNNIVTTPLGYTQYQGTPTSTSSSSTDLSSIMPYLAALMMGMFGSGAQQGASGGSILGA